MKVSILDERSLELVNLQAQTTNLVGNYNDVRSVHVATTLGMVAIKLAERSLDEKYISRRI